MKVYFRFPFSSFLRPSVKNGLTVGITLLILMCVIFIITEEPENDTYGWILYFIASLFGAIVGGVTTTLLLATFNYLASSKYQVEIDSDGLTSYDQKGNKNTFRWDELVDISIETIDQYSFFTFKNHLGSKLFVPLTIKNKQHFFELVADYSNPLNPKFSETFKDFIQNSEVTT